MEPDAMNNGHSVGSLWKWFEKKEHEWKKAPLERSRYAGEVGKGAKQKARARKRRKKRTRR